MNDRIQFLKEVLSVPTKTYQEDLMVEFLMNWLDERLYDYFIDEKKNIYVRKPIPEKDPEFFYPCVICHTDTVHNIDTINVKEEYLPNAQGQIKLSLKAYNDYNQPTGIGGDDKCGVFACLQLLEELPYLKAAFFVSEETGCHGSKYADEHFFSDVGYAIQFDAPENWMITERCYGEVLFDRDSEFFEVCNNVLTENMDKDKMRYMIHPYTDVYALRQKFDFSCINISIGYYDYHTKDEYVVVEDVFNGIKSGRKMIDNLGYRIHHKKPKTKQILI